MEDIPNVSSEEELLGLRNEGKISEDEYEELRNAMQKSSKLNLESPPPAATDKSKSKRKLGKIAFVLMLAGIILPNMCYLVFEYGIFATSHPDFGPWFFFLGLPLEIAGFVMGVIAWPDTFAKVTVVAIAFIVVLAWLFNADLQW